MKRINCFHGLVAGCTARWRALGVSPTRWSTGTKLPCRRSTVGRPGPIGIVDIALVQVAVHDAVQAIDRQFEPYHAEIDTRRGERAKVAAPLPLPRRRTTCSSASIPRRRQLSTRPTSTILRTKVSTAIPGSSSDSRSPRVFFRCAARTRILCRHLLSAELALALWRPTPSFLEIRPRRRRSRRWRHRGWPTSIHSRSRAPTRFRAPPPPALTSDRYTRDYNEVEGARLSRQREAHGRTNGSRVFLQSRLLRCCGTARCAGSPRDICARAATPPGCSRWRISRPPMRSSRAGTARRSTPSGGRSRRSRKAMPTAIRRPSAIRRGNR